MLLQSCQIKVKFPCITFNAHTFSIFDLLIDSSGLIFTFFFILGITENIIRGVCKVLQYTVPRYRDSASQSYVQNTIDALLSQHREWTIKHLAAVLGEIATTDARLMPVPLEVTRPRSEPVVRANAGEG